MKDDEVLIDYLRAQPGATKELIEAWFIENPGLRERKGYYLSSFSYSFQLYIKRSFENLMRRAAKIDKNQPDIVKILDRAGAYVLDTHRLENSFDILVGFRGQLYIVEIKNPENRWTLTEGEEKCRNGFVSVGVPYHIVETPWQALDVLGLKEGEDYITDGGDIRFLQSSVEL